MTPDSSAPGIAATPRSGSAPHGHVPGCNGEPINILLVDDEPRNLVALETVLENPGYRLVRADSAEAALLALVAEEFALLVLDIQMPGMNGFELAHMIKQRKKTASLPIIFLTAFFSQDEHVLEGYSTGAVDYLHKPINAPVLRSKVAVFAELHRRTCESALANRALQAEVAERRHAEEQLRLLNEELEGRVQARTAELSESEARLRAAAEALRETDRRKDEFLAMLGHELRNPLGAIRHAVQIAQETGPDPAARGWTDDVIDRQSRQLARMVDDLLDVARIRSGRIELRPETLDLRAIFTRAGAVVRPLIEQRHHTLSIEAAEPLPICGDAARLEQIFVNLLNNAAKYTPEGGRIVLRAECGGGEATISVIDNGVGIAPELLPHVFDLFKQADSSLDRAQGGLGIGLTVVKSLVEMHGGRIAAESGGPRQGTSIVVRLPLAESQAAETTSVPKVHAGAFPRALRVLVVDDHEDAAEALARLLRRRNCEVRIAHDGRAGLQEARNFRPEALLLDLGLPDLDGYALASTLRAEPAFADALFIAISGYAQESDRARSLAAGFDHHCAKPVDFAALMAVLETRVAKAAPASLSPA